MWNNWQPCQTQRRKDFDSYRTELFPNMMHVMPGNKPSGTWLIEHELGYSLEECIGWHFPHYDQWCMEWQSDNRDKQMSSENFLYHLISFLTYVAIEDAPYWLKHFPQHKHSLFRVNCQQSL